MPIFPKLACKYKPLFLFFNDKLSFFSKKMSLYVKK